MSQTVEPPDPRLPLSGIRVLDFTQIMMGPLATQLLGDFGADVIKVERPHGGDIFRWAVTDPAGANHPAFTGVNRSKRSLALDLSKSEGRQLAKELVKHCDVIVNNFRPAVMKRLDLGYEEVRALNPRAIYAQGTGWGIAGPLSGKGGQDILAQAMSGVMERRAPGVPRGIYPTSLADYTAGMHLAQGILLALIARERTGEGQFLEVNLYDALLAMQALEAPVALANRDYEMNWAGLPLVGVFETADAPLVIVGAFKEDPLADICSALEIDDLTQDASFATPEAQARNRDELQTILANRLRSGSRDHWLSRLEAQDILCAPVQDLAAALDHPQTKANDMVWAQEHQSEGTIRVIGSPIHLHGTPPRRDSAAPVLGADTRAILLELGLADEAIDALAALGVVQT